MGLTRAGSSAQRAGPGVEPVPPSSRDPGGMGELYTGYRPPATAYRLPINNQISPFVRYE